MSLPLALIIEKNKLVSTAPWLTLLAVTLPDTSVLRLAKNTEDVTFGGHLYSAWALDIGDARVSNDGKIPAVAVTVANPARQLTAAFEANSGLVGCAVQIMVVHADNLTEDYTDLTLDLVVISATADDQVLAFTLGAENPMRRRFPPYIVLPRSCPWVFKGAECKYAGGASTCARTLDACTALANTANFGGRPGIVGAPRFVA